MPLLKRGKKRQKVAIAPPLREKPYVVYFNGSTLYHTKQSLVNILETWGIHDFEDSGRFMTGVGWATWEKRKS